MGGVEKQRIAVLTEGYARGLTLNVDAYNKAYMNPACADVSDTDRVVVAKDIYARAFIDTFIDIFR